MPAQAMRLMASFTHDAKQSAFAITMLEKNRGIGSRPRMQSIIEERTTW